MQALLQGLNLRSWSILQCNDLAGGNILSYTTGKRERTSLTFKQQKQKIDSYFLLQMLPQRELYQLVQREIL